MSVVTSRSRLTAALVVLLAAAVALIGLTANAGAAPARVQHTVKHIVRPVRANGTPAAGYRVKSFATVVTCDDGVSPSAVDPDIRACSPDSADALACWKSTGHAVLCLLNARSHTLARFPLSGGFARVSPKRLRTPLALTLIKTGATCYLRDGGTADSEPGHPNWQATYFCQGGITLYGPTPFTSIDAGHNPWTVHAYDPGNARHEYDTRVGNAYYVGTAA